MGKRQAYAHMETPAFQYLERHEALAKRDCICNLCSYGGRLWILLFKAPRAEYVSVLETKVLDREQKELVLHALEEKGIPFREEQGGGVFVPKKYLVQAESVFEKSPTRARKGFELFDTNTWIKGEKRATSFGNARFKKGSLKRI